MKEQVEKSKSLSGRGSQKGSPSRILKMQKLRVVKICRLGCYRRTLSLNKAIRKKERKKKRNTIKLKIEIAIS